MQDIYSMNIKRMGMLNRGFDTNKNTKKKEKNNLKAKYIAIKAVIRRNIAKYQIGNILKGKK